MHRSKSSSGPIRLDLSRYRRISPRVGDLVINMASNVALMGAAGLDCYTRSDHPIDGSGVRTPEVRVNAIAPAATTTDRVRGRFEAAIRE